jgi:hypothetical protein
MSRDVLSGYGRHPVTVLRSLPRSEIERNLAVSHTDRKLLVVLSSRIVPARQSQGDVMLFNGGIELPFKEKDISQPIMGACTLRV